MKRCQRCSLPLRPTDYSNIHFPTCPVTEETEQVAGVFDLGATVNTILEISRTDDVYNPVSKAAIAPPDDFVGGGGESGGGGADGAW